jgi:hypothetical protein
MPDDANNPGGSADDSQVRWNLYLEQERLARQNIRDSTSDFDKNLLALSSGALGISLAFIKDIVPLEQAMWLTLRSGIRKHGLFGSSYVLFPYSNLLSPLNHLHLVAERRV